MTIKVTYNVTDVYVTQDVSPVYINVSYSGGGSGGASVWGGITGTLSDQTDLQSALDAKFDDPTGTTSQYLRGDGSLATFPSLTGFVPYTGATANVDLGTHTILAQNATIASSGSGDTVTLNHSSGSGIGLNITKGGNGEGLYINKTGGSGNAATIIGTINATTLVKSGGTSSQFLKADGTVDSSVYVPTSRELTINGVTYDLSANRSWTVASGISGSGASGQVSYWDGTTSQAGSSNLVWDNANIRLGIGATPASGNMLHVGGNTFSNTFTTNGGLLLNRNGDEANLTFQRDGTPTAQLRALNGGGFRITGAVAGTEWARFHSTGNFGIGTGATDSGQRLQVQGTTLLNGNVTFSSATGMTWDATNSRLGIGTNAPDYKFTLIDNSTIFTQRIRNTNSAGRAGLFMQNDSTAYSGLGTYGTAFVISSLQNNTVFFSSHNFQISAGDLTGTGNILFSTGANSTNLRMQLFSTGNLLIQNGGTFTDSGERLQVTGTMKVTGLLSLQTGLTSTGGLLTQNTSVNSGRMNLLNLRNTAGGYNAALNSSIAVSFTNRVTAGVWSDDFIELKVYDNGSTTSKSGYNFYTHNNQLTTANSVLAMSINGQSVGIGIETPNASAILDVTSTTQGFLPPRMTTTQKNAITSPAAGLVVYDTTLNKLCVYTTAWETITSL